MNGANWKLSELQQIPFDQNSYSFSSIPAVFFVGKLPLIIVAWVSHVDWNSALILRRMRWAENNCRRNTKLSPVAKMSKCVVVTGQFRSVSLMAVTVVLLWAFSNYCH